MTRYLLDNDPRREQRRQSLLLDRLEARYRPSFSREIKRAMREMIDAYSQTGEIGPPRDHYDKTEQLFERMATDSAVVFGKRIIEQGKSAGLLIEHKEDFASMMRRLALSYIGQETVRKRITSIVDTTREQIIAQVDKGYRDGLGVAEIAKLVSSNVEQISRWRGALIARTETHSAANFGADQAARETGLPLRKEWVSAEDERTRAAHRAADGQVVGMDDAFDVGGESLMRPGDPAGSAANTVNCFPPWSLVRLAGLKAAMKREYTGDLIQMSFGGPVDFTVTPNHPVLTDRGWVAARFVMKGDKVLDAGLGDVGEVGPGPDIANRCARADDLYNAAQVSGRVVRPAGVVVNLHGEVPCHNVNIVAFKGELRDAFYSSGIKLFGDISLADTHVSKGLLLFGRMSGLGELVATDKSDCFMRLRSAGASLFWRGKRSGSSVAFGDVGQSNPPLCQASVDHRAAEVDLFSDGIDGISLVEKVNDVAPDAISYNLPSLMGATFKVRKIASIKSFHYSGPVYNFESDTGILCTDSVVNHNCRCGVSHIVVDD